MKHTLTPQRYLILLAVMLTASVGDTLLSHGMSQIGPVDFHHLDLLWHALFNPFVASGIILLIGYFAVALPSRFCLHEPLSIYRWAGIVLIVCAVGFVAGGPSRTEHESSHPDLDLMDSGAGRR